jgi:N-ethylmaleimide reductase
MTFREKLTMKTLFNPIRIGDYQLPNRIVMAPLTRGRANNEGIPQGISADYYGQRATAGLIIAEATAISKQGRGWMNSPGIYTPEQILGWRKVADAVHQNEGRIFVHLWHMGAAVHPDFMDGASPVSASDVTLEGALMTPKGRNRMFEQARALTQQEIKSIVADFVQAAKNAIEAGLDGVEIHAANSFLIDQFIKDGSNQREDEYGGTVDKRLRFMLEVVAAVSEAIGPGRVGIRLSPSSQVWDLSDSQPEVTYLSAAKKLSEYNLAYLHLLEARPEDEGSHYLTPKIRAIYQGVLIANAGYQADSANQSIGKGEVDAVAFGQAFIANPDLVKRFEKGHVLSDAKAEYFYTNEALGYSDYPEFDIRDGLKVTD